MQHIPVFRFCSRRCNQRQQTVAIERRIRQDYSNPILIMILIPIVTELVKIFLLWLVERRSNAVLAASWTLESHDA